MAVRIGLLGLAVLAGCGKKPIEPVFSDSYPLDQLEPAGSVRGNGALVQAVVQLPIERPPYYAELAPGDALALRAEGGQGTPFTAFQEVLVAHLPLPDSAQAQFALELSRGEQVKSWTIALPPPFELEVGEPGPDGWTRRVSWEASDEGLIRIDVESPCLERPFTRLLEFDQGWYELQAADLSLLETPCALWVTVRRSLEGGMEASELAVESEQVRSVSFEVGALQEGT